MAWDRALGLGVKILRILSEVYCDYIPYDLALRAILMAHSLVRNLAKWIYFENLNIGTACFFFQKNWQFVCFEKCGRGGWLGVPINKIISLMEVLGWLPRHPCTWQR